MKEDKTVYLSSAYLAPVEYFQLINTFPAVIEQQDNFIKQTYRNRCRIATAQGMQTLSIPIEKPETLKCLTRDIRISDHDNWRHLHWTAIRSAYNSSPFFEYYEDDLRPFYEKKFNFLFDFNEELRLLISSLLDIETSVSYSEIYRKELNPNELDYREVIHPKKEALFSTQAYYQVFQDRYGFIPNMSIIDLLFNMGPEAVLFLSKK